MWCTRVSLSPCTWRVCLLVHAILVRVDVPRWTAVALTTLVVFSGVGSEAMIWVITLSLVGSLLCGLAAVLVLLRGDASQPALVGAWVLLVVGLMFSGGGISSVCFAGVFAAWHWGFRRGAQVVSVPAATLAVWYLAVAQRGEDGPGGAGGPSSVWQVTEIPGLVWTGLVTGLQLASGLPSGGALVLLLLAGGAFLLPGPESLRHLAWAGVVAVVVNSALVAAFRLSAGEQSRYYYVVLVLLLPSVALWVMWVGRWLRAPRPARIILVAALLAAYLVNALHLQYAQFSLHRENTARGPALVIGVVTSVEDGQEMLNTTSGEWFNSDFRADLLARAEIRDRLPQLEPTAAGRLDAERWFFVDVDDEGHDLPGPASLTPGDGFPDHDSLPASGCQVQEDTALQSTFTIPTGNGTEVVLTSRSTRVSTTVTRGQETSRARLWQITPGTIHVSTTARDAELEVTLERDGGNGDVLICLP